MSGQGPNPQEVEEALKQLRRELTNPAFANALERAIRPPRKHRPGYRPQPDYAGLRHWARAQSTGTYVGIYDGIEAGMDTAAGRWQTVCDDHGRIISHRTLELARRHAPCPEEWCEVCSGEESPDA